MKKLVLALAITLTFTAALAPVVEAFGTHFCGGKRRGHQC
jgi:hypothetical protein